MQSNKEAFERLVAIMDELREKCPWDRKQTIHSLRQMTLEETYELTEAVWATCYCILFFIQRSLLKKNSLPSLK